MNPLACPHIEDPAAQHRRQEAARRRVEQARAKVREGRWSELTPEERGLIDIALHTAGPDA